MAPTQNLTLAQIGAEIQKYQSELEGLGSAVTDPKNIVTAAKKVLYYIDLAQPHVNMASAAGIPLTEQQSALTALRNRAQRLIAAYS